MGVLGVLICSFVLSLCPVQQDEIILPHETINDVIYVRPITSLAWSDDGAILRIADGSATPNDIVLELSHPDLDLRRTHHYHIDDQTLTLMTEKQLPTFKIGDLRLLISPDREWIAVWNRRFYSALDFNQAGKDLWVWSVADSKLQHYFAPVQGGLNAIAWSPDSQLLLISTGDGNLVFWDFLQNKPLYRWQAPHSAKHLAWSNQNQLAIADIDRISIWDITPIIDKNLP